MVCTGWSFWLSVVMRTRTVPRVGRNLDSWTSMISQWSRKVSPGRTGRGQRSSSTPLPMMPSDSGSVWMMSCIVSAVVCHPLAISSLKKVEGATVSLKCQGCGSNSPPNRLIASASTTARASDVNTCPGVRSSRKALSTAFSFDEARAARRASGRERCRLCAGATLSTGDCSHPHRSDARRERASDDWEQAPPAPTSGGRLMRRHRAGRDGDSEHLGDGGVVKAVLYLGDRPHHAVLGGSRVGARLQRRLVRAEPRLLVDLRARIPEQNLRGNVAADWLAAGVEQGDAFLPGSVEQVVGLGEHRGDGQPLAGLGRDLELEVQSRPDVAGTAGPNRSIGGAHMDDARLTLQGFLERGRRSILRQGLESLAAVRLN